MKTNQNTSESHGKNIREEKFTKGRRTRSRHHIGRIALVLVVLFALVAGSAGWYYNHLLNQIQYVQPHEESFNPDLRPEDLTEPDLTTTVSTSRPTVSGETTLSTTTIDWAARYETSSIPVLSDSSIQNIVLIGNDADGSASYSRADTIIILSIDKRSNVIRLASILRDTGVIMPGREEYGIGKINHAYAYGGPRLLMDTIEKNFRVHIDNYISVGFEGFDKIVDSIGGLDITLTDAEAAWLGMEPGTHHMNGYDTERYVRIRKIDSDFQRTSRQRHVLELMAQKARGMSVLQLTGLLEEILPLVSTGLTKGEMSSLLLQAPAMLGYAMQQSSVPLPGSYVSIDYTFHLDIIPNIDHLHSFLYGS